MDPDIHPSHTLTLYTLVIHPEPPGQYTAQVLGIPEIRAVAKTEEEAVGETKKLLTQWLSTARMVMVNVPVPFQPNLTSPFSKIDPNDPIDQEYLEELRRMKQEDLENTLREYDQECPNSSSTPTT